MHTALRTSYELLTDAKIAVASFAVSIAHLAILLFVWTLECFGPETDETLDGFVKVEASVKESPYATANFYNRWVHVLSNS